MTPINTTNTAGLLVQATALVMESNKQDAAHAANKVQKNSSEIREKSGETLELTKDMREIEGAAKEMQEKAADTKWIGKVFGVRGSREKKAAGLVEDATKVQGEVDLKSASTEELRTETEDRLDDMKRLNEDSSSASQFLNNALAQEYVVRP